MVAGAILSPAQEQPSPRLDAPIAYDGARRTVWLFGGQAASGDTNDLWAFSLETQSWRQVSPQGTPPSPRHGHTLNYDARGRRLIVFAGQARGFFNDTFAYEIEANRWVQLNDGAGAPPRRYAHSGVYDPDGNRILISHGFTSSGRFDDTWALDLATNRWRDLNPAGPRPLRRCLHHATFSADRQQMYLYGGCASGFGPCPLGDLWSYDVRTNRWTEIRAASAPAARERYGFGLRGDQLVLFGGGTQAGRAGDLWEFDLRGGTWMQGTSPGAARWRHQSTESAEESVVFFFGGEVNGQLSNELVQYRGETRVRNAFSNLSTPASPGEIRTAYGSGFARGEVRVNGTVAPVLFQSDAQINFQIPETTTGPAVLVEVYVDGLTRLTERLDFVSSWPAVAPAWLVEGPVLTVWATGLGLNPEIQVRGGDRVLPVIATSTPVPGVWQISARIADLEPGSYEIRVRIGERDSQPGLILQVR